MTIDLPHIIATGVILFGVIWVIDRMQGRAQWSKKKLLLYRFLGIFVAILILNLLWPYGGGSQL